MCDFESIRLIFTLLKKIANNMEYIKCTLVFEYTYLVNQTMKSCILYIAMTVKIRSSYWNKTHVTYRHLGTVDLRHMTYNEFRLMQYSEHKYSQTKWCQVQRHCSPSYRRFATLVNTTIQLFKKLWTRQN